MNLPKITAPLNISTAHIYPAQVRLAILFNLIYAMPVGCARKLRENRSSYKSEQQQQQQLAAGPIESSWEYLAEDGAEML